MMSWMKMCLCSGRVNADLVLLFLDDFASRKASPVRRIAPLTVNASATAAKSAKDLRREGPVAQSNSSYNTPRSHSAAASTSPWSAAITAGLAPTLCAILDRELA